MAPGRPWPALGQVPRLVPHRFPEGGTAGAPRRGVRGGGGGAHAHRPLGPHLDRNRPPPAQFYGGRPFSAPGGGTRASVRGGAARGSPPDDLPRKGGGGAGGAPPPREA